MKKIVVAVGFLTAALVSSCADDDPATENDENVVNVQITSNQFVPANITVRAGQTVRWTWAGGEHNVVSGTCDTPDDQFRSGAPATGGTFEKVFPTAGTYPYYCELHCQMGMTGQITVQ